MIEVKVRDQFILSKPVVDTIWSFWELIYPLFLNAARFENIMSCDILCLFLYVLLYDFVYYAQINRVKASRKTNFILCFINLPSVCL